MSRILVWLTILFPPFRLFVDILVSSTNHCTSRHRSRNKNYQHCQFIKGNVPKDWPGYEFDPATVSTSASSSDGGLHAGVIVAIVLVALIFVALVAIVVIRKRHRKGQDPAAAQNAARDPSQALKLDADGSILQEVMDSMSRTPSTAVHTYEYENGDAVSVEVERPMSPVGGYSDNPKSNGRNGSRRSYGGNML